MKHRRPHLAAPLALLSALSTPAAAQGIAPWIEADPVRFESDSFSRKVLWRTPEGRYGAAVHATLMPDGSILFIGYTRPTEVYEEQEDAQKLTFTMTPTPLGEPLPTDAIVEGQPVPYEIDEAFVFPELVLDDLFCSGHSLLADGSFFSAGGTRVSIDILSLDATLNGLNYATRFDGSTWVREAEAMKVSATLGNPARWYCTVTRLWDGRMLVTGGYDMVFPVPWHNRSAEIFDPGTGSWQILANHPTAPPSLPGADYTHVFLLPSPVDGFDLLGFGDGGQPVGMSLGGGAFWQPQPELRPDASPWIPPNIGASSALLPIRVQDGEWGYANGSVLIAGGGHFTEQMHRADVYDPVEGTWKPSIELEIRRHHPSTVLLPDGRVLVLAGHDDATMDPGVTRAQVIDPASGFEVLWGRTQEAEVRGYHTVSLLLPDGRVLVGGGRDHATEAAAERTSFRYYSPAYMNRPRPELVSPPSELTLGEPFQVVTSGAAPAELVLMGLGSMTHSVDMNQRYVQLEVASVESTGGLHSVDAVAPPTARVAPPGHYMLFALDADRTPSVAAIVQLK
ncbi:MAG: galactose oxidase early set domain-containing protein [Planctomycetota bacterium]